MLFTSDDNDIPLDVSNELEAIDPSMDEGIILGHVSNIHTLLGATQPRSLCLSGSTLK